MTNVGRTYGAARQSGHGLLTAVLRLCCVLIAASALALLPASAGAAPQGLSISNTASLVYTTGSSSVPQTVSSNTVVATTTVLQTPATIEFLQYAPTSTVAEMVVVQPTLYSATASTAGPFLTESPAIPVGSTGAIDLTKPVPLVPATIYHAGDPVFIRLTDLDRNTDPTVEETVFITIQDPRTGDTEVLQLTETGPNTGVFTGYIMTDTQQPVNGNGKLDVTDASSITATYSDPGESGDVRTTAALIDPYGMVFSSATGQPVDGASITLIDDAANGPATVYGDDGVSSFPATVTSGGTAQDSSGRSYTFAAGSYRFPFIKPGKYHFQVQPPAGYRAPSQVADADLQKLSGAPFALVTPGSRGEEFTVNPGPAIHMDIPVDPVSSRLYLQKTAGKDTAAIGDFVQYKLTVQNIDATAPVPGVTITDKLPAAFRYRKGSARLNGAATADPAISEDGRSLTFTVGDLAAGGSAEVRYVAEVGVGARPGKAINVAVANGSLGAVSNTAQATVLVTDDLFGEKATIVGRVFADGCGNPDRADDESGGVSGVRVYLENGTYVVTDKNGMFHFEAVKPGTHVVQLDTVTLPENYEILQCDENTRFAGTKFSQFVDVQGGTLWRADFHAGLRPRITGEAAIELRSALTSSVTATTPVEGHVTVSYAVPLSTGFVPVRDMRLTVMLPDGLTYAPGTARLDGTPIADPEIADTALTFRLGEAPVDWEGTVRFDAFVPLSGGKTELVTRAILTFDTPQKKDVRTPVVDNTLVREVRESQQSVPDMVLHPRFPTLSAALTRKDKKDLNRVIKRLQTVVVHQIEVIGHTDSQPIRGRGRKKFADNYVLSEARARTVAKYLADALHLAPEQVKIVGKGPDEPVASNKTAKGRTKNRRVELKLETKKVILWSDVRTEKDASGKQTVATTGLRPGETWAPDKQEDQAAEDGKKMPVYDAEWLAKAAPGFAWLWPSTDFRPSIPSLKVAIKHDPALTVRLTLNGAPVDPVAFDGTLKRPDNALAVSTWSSVNLVEGDNILEAVATDASGAEIARETRTIHYSGPPVKAVLVPERSRLLADGKNPPVIAVRLLDKDGKAVREGLVGEFSVDPPYAPQKRAEALQQSPLIDQTSANTKFSVGDDGVALFELQPTMQSGEAVVRVPLGSGIQEVRAWLKAEDRDWILVGLAEGTIGYNVVKGNMESLGAAGDDEHYYDEGRVAFYAKGRIKGEWLLTAAYDTAKETGSQPGLYPQAVDPNQYYLLYGDATDQRFDAASSKKLYVKLERDQFYALFGDYNTGLTMTELSRYSRTFTGVKSEMKSEHFEYNAFLSQNNQAQVKDEIPGDGTSGLYHLSRTGIVLNSESVTIQTRDRFRSEVIVSEQKLSRYIDYSIDYDAGTIWFKAPVYSRDANYNPVYIVVEYETTNAADLSYTYGGRGAVKALDGRVVVGATHVHEGQSGTGGGDLNGMDASVDLGNRTKLRAEAAATSTDQSGTKTDGSAYLAEVQHQSERIDGKVYVREQGSGFGLGQQAASETGTRKIGGDATYRLGGPWSVGAEAFRQDTLATGAERDLAELRGRYAAAQYDMLAGVRRVDDTLGTGEDLASDQVFAGMKYRVTDRLSVRVQHDQSIGANDSVDYPTRTTVGADYKLSDTATAFAEQEFTHSDAADTATSRVGLKASPWAGGQIGSTVEEQTTENGVRLFSTTGLKQTWQITKQWSVDGGLDRSSTIRRTDTAQTTLNPNVPPASGSTEDFTAVSLGVGYRQEHWSWTARVENRTAQTEDKFSTFMGANGDVREGLALASGLHTFRSVTNTGAEKFTGDLRFGAAYRPKETRVILLDRLDFLKDEQQGYDMDYDNWRVVNNYVMNIKTDSRTQLSLLYGGKYVKEAIDENDYRGYTDLAGLEGRYDVTKRWDIGLRGLRLHSWDLGTEKNGAGASVGFNAGRNVWISLGYNFSGFRDRDFSKADFTDQGPFIKLRMKFDQVSVRDAVRWITGQ